MNKWNLFFKVLLIIVAIVFVFTAIAELVSAASTLMNIVGLGLAFFTGWFIGVMIINFFNKKNKK